MVREKWFEASRNHWKRKAVATATALREQRKAVNRYKQKNEELKAALEELKKSHLAH